MINIILKDFIYGLDNTVRFNGTRTLQQKETVSQHSFWVIFYCNLVFRSLFHRQLMIEQNLHNQRNLFIDYNNMYTFLMKQAIYHDFDENFTGDVLYDTKYDSEFGDEVKKSLNKIKLKEIELLERDILYHDYVCTLKTDCFAELNGFDLTKEQKAICFNILKMADWMSCLRYANTELELGNKVFEEIISRAINGVESCLTQIEITITLQGHDDNGFVRSTKSQLIELKSKLNIL